MSEQASAPAAPVENSQPAEQSSAPVAENVEASSSPQEQIQEAIDNGASPEQIQDLIEEFEISLDGKKVKKQINLKDKNQLKQMLQLAEVSKKRMAETAEIKKLFESVIGKGKQDPWDLLKQLGHDPDELAEMRISERVEQLKKSPEQLEREKIQKELEEARLEAKRLKEEKETIEFQKMKETAAVQIENEIMGALETHKVLPKSPFVVKKIADHMLWAMNNGFEDATVEDILPLVEKEYTEDLAKHFEMMPLEALEQVFGKSVFERMRKKRIAKAPESLQSQVKPTTASVSSSNQKQEPKKKIPMREFFRNVGRGK